jgi:hypothetical protein
MLRDWLQLDYLAFSGGGGSHFLRSPFYDLFDLRPIQYFPLQ